MKKLLVMGTAAVAAVALAACGNSVHEAVERECNGPWGKSVQVLPARTVGGSYNWGEIKITCADGSEWVAGVK